jgi:hypothetical protein
MVEVFKTNVTNDFQAKKLVGVIEDRFDGYKANFDLDDCDRILRIQSSAGIDIDSLTHFLKDMGVKAEVLPDEVDSWYSFFEVERSK